MKKIIAGAALAALTAGMAFAAEPVADVKVNELSGNAQVKWGVDLDAGKTGFENTVDSHFKVNLFNEGTNLL